MRRHLVNLVGFLLFATVARSAEPPIPQDPERQAQRLRDVLAWNQRTLAGAFEKVGKKDPRWDALARQTLEAAARWLSQQPDPQSSAAEVFAVAQRARDAGCDDPLILYVYARSSQEAERASPADLAPALRRRGNCPGG